MSDALLNLLPDGYTKAGCHRRNWEIPMSTTMISLAFSSFAYFGSSLLVLGPWALVALGTYWWVCLSDQIRFDRIRFLFSRAGRKKLHELGALDLGDCNKRWEQQSSGHFYSSSVRPSPVRKSFNGAHQIHYFEHCNAKVAYYHRRGNNGKTLVLLHGNPSWSYEWSDILDGIQDYDVYLLDWIGHGCSDRFQDARAYTMDLHISTLERFVRLIGLDDLTIAAHDWGGCIALLTLPKLSPKINLFLVNSFFPPQIGDIRLTSYALYCIWFCSTGMLGEYLPQWLALWYMVPTLTPSKMGTLCSPFPVGQKQSIRRFGHLATGLPAIVYENLDKIPFKGLFHLDVLYNQARIRRYGLAARSYRYHGRQGQIGLAFGKNDELLGDYKNVIERVTGFRGEWISDAGHIPMFEKKQEVTDALLRFSARCSTKVR